jgi:hypothetical protein
VDEVTPAKPVTAQDPSVAKGRPDHNGLTPHVAAVEAARDRLGRDLDLLNTEVRAQMGQTAEKTAWKLAATVSAVVASIAIRKVLMAGWKKSHKGNLPPTNPADRQTQWTEALAWSAATGLGVGIARMIATRGAAGAWEKLTGALPPGLEEVSA